MAIRKKNMLDTISQPRWKEIGVAKRAGVLVPLFSIYSKKSQGIGDFEDLRLLVDWCAATGNSILQLLPMNEVGATFCPYDAVSSFALEPIYISLELLAPSGNALIKNSIADLRKAFVSGRPNVNYAVKNAKLKVLWQIYKETSKKTKTEVANFAQVNSYWLEDYALFKALKALHDGKPWYEWPEEYKNRDEAISGEFRQSHADEIGFYEWIQWVACEQFKAAKAYAGAKNILLKGDMPILMSRDSADVWAHTGFFKLDFAAGAPPDIYCAKGQRWGMPTYDWDNVESDNYGYVKEKLAFTENFYDILRVDHVVGLFRIWSINHNEPAQNEGLNGFFDPPNEAEWPRHGRKILSVMVENSKMLLCGEDLGIIPKVCPDTMSEFGVPGNDVQRWMKDWKVRHDFLEPKDYRLLAVAMLSTHDTTNWAAWWENEAGTVDEALFIRKCGENNRVNYEAVKERLFDPAFSKHGRLRWRDSISSANLLVDILGRPKEELADFIDLYKNAYKEKDRLWKHFDIRGPVREKSDPEIVEAVLRITLNSRSVFCVELLNDYLYLADAFEGDPYKYRINTPGTVSGANWSLTIPLSLEKLIKHPVCGKIKSMITAAGRSA